MLKICENCGKEYEAKTNRSRFCSGACYTSNFCKTHSNAICAFCGKPFWSKGSSNLCCSEECGKRYSHKRGIQSYWKCIEEERNIPSLKDWINNEHNIKMRTILDISNDLNVTRITIMRWCKMWGVKTRTVSEDNYRRYANMSAEDKNIQTEAAHKQIRILFKNDKWKNNQIKKVLGAQNFNESKPELAIRQSLIDHGYGDFIPQYQLGSFFVDIAFPDIKLAIEIDGEYWHSLPKVVSRDKRKNSYIQDSCGWDLVRVPATPCVKDTENMTWYLIQCIEASKLDCAVGE